MTGTLLTLTHATERDIDLLLVEEMKCNFAFVAWFVHQVNKQGDYHIDYDRWEVFHSKRRTHNRREIDIQLELKNGKAKPTVLLIENKLDTSEQINQAESYTEECALLVREGSAVAALPILICPENYYTDNKDFAGKFYLTITYEMIASMFEIMAEEFINEDGEIDSTETLVARFLYRSSLIRQAIDKSRRGYEPVVQPGIAEFNKKYVELCQGYCSKLIPGTSMLKQGRPGESKTMIFDTRKTLYPSPDLPQIRIVHQLREGNANINFYGWGNHFEHVATTIKNDLKGTPYKVAASINKRKGGNSGLMIYAKTPAIDNLQDFDSQEGEILEGIKATDNLRQWFTDNQPLIQKWNEIISAY